MTREKIRQKQIEEAVSTSITETLMSAPYYEFSPRATDLLECAFRKGAEWADEKPASPWHSVADGDLPEEANGDAIDPPFLVTVRDGYTFMAYYGRSEDDGEMDFFDDCGLALAVDYWMEIPKLPNKEEL